MLISVLLSLTLSAELRNMLYFCIDTGFVELNGLTFNWYFV
jgi:hypothetical protein